MAVTYIVRRPKSPRRALSLRARKKAAPEKFCVKERCNRRPVAIARCATHATEHLDWEWAAVVKARGECELAGVDGVRCGGALEAAHGIPRRYRATRHVVLNGWCICAGHHRFYSDRWPAWLDVMKARLGEGAYDELWRIARSSVVPDPADVLVALGRAA